MIIEQTLGNIYSSSYEDKIIDKLDVDWHETNKRILTRQSRSGKEIQMRFLKETQQLHHGDILLMSKDDVVVVNIMKCDALLILPSEAAQFALVCYEIGNRHLPLFYQDNEILTPDENVLQRFFDKHNIESHKVLRRLTSQMKTTIAPHSLNAFGPEIRLAAKQ
jgi:urease accessory protein